VWDVISTPGNLELCHPFCASNPVKAWPGPDSRDEVHYLSGWVYERRFLRWHEGIGYDLEIGRPSGGMSAVSWRITPIEDDRCILKITVYPHILQNWPTVFRWVPYVIRLRPMLKKYLESVVRGFEWYVVRGQSVSRNQFGRHPWFSATAVRAASANYAKLHESLTKAILGVKNTPGMRRYWRQRKSYLHSDFADYVGQLLLRETHSSVEIYRNSDAEPEH